MGKWVGVNDIYLFWIWRWVLGVNVIYLVFL